MTQIIIFPNDNGGVVFCYPNPDCGLSVEQIASKDVPAGKPFLIVDEEAVPQDHTFFDAFEADFNNPHGHGLGHDAWVAAQETQEVQ